MWPIYVINMKENTVRMENVHRQFTRLGIPYRRVEAVNGAELSRTEMSKAYKPRWWKHYVPLLPAEIGRYLSHLKLWEQIANGVDDGAFVFEDDFITSDDLKYLLNVVIDAPDWDMVKLHVPDYAGVRSVDKKPLAERYELADAYDAPFSAMAYGVTRAGAQKLINKYPPFSRPVDLDVARFWESGISIFQVQPSVVTNGLQTTIDGSIGDLRFRDQYPECGWLRSNTIEASYRLHQRVSRFRGSAERRLFKLWKYLKKPGPDDDLRDLVARVQTGLSLRERARYCPGLRERVSDVIEYTADTMADHHGVAVDLLERLDHHQDATHILHHLRLSPNTGTRKIISRRYRFLWLRVPKVASSSIIDTIMSIDDSAELLKFTSTADLYRKYPELQDYFSFAFIRHPRSRILSCYRDKIQEAYPGTMEHRDHVAPFYGLNGGIGFDEFLAWLNTPYGSDAFADPHWLSQTRQVTLPDGRLPDFVGLFENLADDWSKVVSTVGLPAAPLTHLNPSSGEAGDYSDDLISARYADDIALWNQVRESR